MATVRPLQHANRQLIALKPNTLKGTVLDSPPIAIPVPDGTVRSNTVTVPPYPKFIVTGRYYWLSGYPGTGC
eukprot:678-Rhodomonas_salina.1